MGGHRSRARLRADFGGVGGGAGFASIAGMGGAQLEKLFERGVLIRSSPELGNLVCLIRAIAAECGVEGIDKSGTTGELLTLIGPTDHLIFILLDGLGMNLVEKLPKESFLCSHLKRTLAATCPSTTACALTTIATAEYPNRHGVTGWFTHVPELGLTATVLPFTDRFTGEGLVRRGLKPADMLPLPPILPRMSRKALTIVPHAIVNTPYNEWSRGGAEGKGYRTIPNAIDEIIQFVSHAQKPTYVHLYLPEVDSICHRLGSEGGDVIPEVMKIDAQLARLSQALDGKARVVVTADHGLIDVPESKQTLLTRGDPLVELLEVPISGDARMPVFHVKEGRKREFVAQAEERFGEHIAFVATEVVEVMELFGPGPIAEAVRPRFGDFVGFPFDRTTLAYHPPEEPPGHLFKAVHAGLSPQEMWVPVCVA